MKRSPIKRRTPLRNKLPDGPARCGEDRACVVCARQFYVSPIEMLRGGKYCSRVCMGRANSLRSERRTLRASCTVCGSLLADPGPPSKRRKTCGDTCANEAKRRAKEAARNPNFMGDDAAKVRWRSQAATSCAVCGGDDRLQLHHVVYEQHVRRAGGNRWDPRDSLTTCCHCHTAHHHSVRPRISLNLLRDENFEFAFELLGPAAFDYLRRRYSGADARLDALLDRGQPVVRAAA